MLKQIHLVGKICDFFLVAGNQLFGDAKNKIKSDTFSYDKYNKRFYEQNWNNIMHIRALLEPLK